ncbi:MAG: hypothetical protein R2819_13645 [Allomuricauda sp.]
MKHTFLLTLALITIGFMAMAQDRSSFKAGFNAGLPVGDVADFSSFSMGLDLAYHWGISELLDGGITTGYIHSFGETNTISLGDATIETQFEDFQFIPMALALRLYPTYEFKLGADVGYAVGLGEQSESGLYVRPSIGYNITGNTELNVSYISVSNDLNFSVLSLGILFLF